MHLSSARVWTAAIASGFYLLCALLVYLRRSTRPGVAKIAAFYLSVAALWSAGLALQQSGRLSFVNYSLLSDLAAVGLLVLSVFFLLLTRLILGYRNGAWSWIILGLAWCSFAVVMGLVGWLLPVYFSPDGWLAKLASHRFAKLADSGLGGISGRLGLFFA